MTTDGATQTRTHNQQNEITSISGQGAVTYDANGNTTADGSGKTFVYDAWNRLVRVVSGGTTLASYGIDGTGRRITETHGVTTTDLYNSSGWQVLEERIGGVLQARNVFSPVYVDALILRDQSSQHNGVLDQRLYVQTDANWNVTANVDASGNVLERYVYDPYGAVTVLTPTWATRGSSAYGWMYFFQGKRYDGLYDSRGRVYSPTLGRPLQADALGLAPDINDYRWEGNGPTNGADPSGLANPAAEGWTLVSDTRHKLPNNGNPITLYSYSSPMVWCSAIHTLFWSTPEFWTNNTTTITATYQWEIAENVALACGSGSIVREHEYKVSKNFEVETEEGGSTGVGVEADGIKFTTDTNWSHKNTWSYGTEESTKTIYTWERSPCKEKWYLEYQEVVTLNKKVVASHYSTHPDTSTPDSVKTISSAAATYHLNVWGEVLYERPCGGH